MTRERVSVVIPVRNGARYLAEAIDSIIGQTRPADQIVVVDDGSVDATPEVIASYGSRITAIAQAARGNSSAGNRGIEAANGELVAFLDADDTWVPEKLAIQLGVLDSEPDVDAVFGLVQQFLSEDADPSLAHRVVIPASPQPGVCRTAMLIRREALERVGGFNESRNNSDFTDWYLRSLEQGLTTRIPNLVIARRRIHGANLGIRESERQWPETLNTLKDSLDRRRGA